MKNIRSISGLFAMCILFAFASCENKAWNDYYENAGTDVPTQTIMEYLYTQANLSTFCEMLERSGYDTVLNQSISYTVWAPINAALEDVDMDDELTVKELVQTHIAHFSVGTSSLRKNKVPVLSGKMVSFVGDLYGQCALISKNINVSNGLVHSINGYVPYMPNSWEYMQRTAGLDSVSTYLTSLSKIEFDAFNSIEIGTNADGQPLYDSVFIEANAFLDKIANITDEDTTYTVLLPNNDAWVDYYERVSQFYQLASTKGGNTQESLSKLTMVQDLVFSGRLDIENLPDSIVSTSGHTFFHPEQLFAGAVKTQTSNGVVYVVDTIRIASTDSWFDTIRVEAENGSYGRFFRNAQISTRLSYGKIFQASNDAYLEVGVSASASLLSKIDVVFPIPNVLSAKYNVYAVFLPESIDYSTIRPNKVSVLMSYLEKGPVLVSDQVIASKQEISGSEPTKFFIGQFDFDYCNVYDRRVSSLSDITTKICIRNEQRKETTKLTNIMRIDCFIFEPVVE